MLAEVVMPEDRNNHRLLWLPRISLLWVLVFEFVGLVMVDIISLIPVSPLQILTNEP